MTSVQLYLTESSDFALISIVFLLSAILSMLHIFHKMALLGFGNYFCNLWNNVLLMMIMACLGMAITWWVFIQQWFESRKRIVSNEDFQFHEFYQMNQVRFSIRPSIHYSFLDKNIQGVAIVHHSIFHLPIHPSIFVH